MNEIDNWLSGDRNYYFGVALFAKHSKNKTLIATFQRGKAQFHQAKLAYELGKLRADVRPSQPVSPKSLTKNRSSIIGRADRKTEIPPVISALKKEISTLYSQIDMIHAALYECGTSNEEKMTAKRKRLLDKRKPLCERADMLYQIKEEYFRTTGAIQKELLDNITELMTAGVEQQPAIADSADKSKIAGMSDLELLKRRQTLRSSISKTQNMLQYQSIKKNDQPTPLPAGPKREQYQAKLASLKSEYNSIIKEIKRRTK